MNSDVLAPELSNQTLTHVKGVTVPSVWMPQGLHGSRELFLYFAKKNLTACSTWSVTE